MRKVDSVWGINVGQCALKALKLRNVDGELRLDAFDIIEHPRILSQPEADRDQLILNALEQFLARNSLSGSRVVVAVPGQSGFTRFVKLPPVERKQVPEIVRFEAEQQIPFDINEVIWRWQAFTDADSPDVEVGIFAMKRTDVGDVLDRFNEAGIAVDVVQMTPLALYNFMDFDEQSADEGATLLVDVGADKTDLVVSDGPRIWARTVQLGGNNFTAALVKAFKLNFNKAEKVKRSAATHKYARQIFQAMRPVFAELVQEISRSIGYYTSLHRESRFSRVIGLGNGFRLPGLQKFLEQNLNLPVVRVDGYNKLPPSAAVNAPAFTENVLSFAVAYGLALQGLGLTKIQTNMLPAEIARRRLWARKRPWFATAAALIIAALAGVTWRARADAGRLAPAGNPDLEHVQDMVARCRSLKSNYDKVKGRDKAQEAEIRRYEKMLAYRDFWPKLHFIVSQAVGGAAKHQGWMNVKELERLTAIPREERMVIEVDSLKATYRENVSDITLERLRTMGGGSVGSMAYSGGGRVMGAATPAYAAAAAQEVVRRRGYVVSLAGRTPQRGITARRFLNNIKQELLARAKLVPFMEVTVGDVVRIAEGQKTTSFDIGPPGAGAAGPTIVDPLTGEDASGDTQFTILWVFAIRDADSPPPDETAQAGKGGAK